MNKNSWLRVLILISVVFMFIYGCGGSGSDKKSTPGDTTPEQSLTPQTITGQLVDSAVSGVSYSCSSGTTGATTSAGDFTCNSGDTVTFSIGGIEFPTVTAVATVTPFTLAGSTDTSNATVINIARFLQSLDSDDDPSNGITVSSGVVSAAGEMTIDFTLPVSEFETAFDVINDSLPDNPSLISQGDAMDHLSEIIDTSGPRTLNGTYVMTTFGGMESNGEVQDIWTDLVTVTFDGAGNGLYVDVDGTVINESFTYSIAADGTYTSGNDQGIVSANGDIFTFRGVAESPGDDMVSYMGIKK